MADNVNSPAGAVFRSKDLGGVQLPLTGLQDQANADALGLVTASPGATTILGRLKAIADAFLKSMFWNDTTTALGSSATFTGTARDVGVAAAAVHGLNYFNGFFLADQAGTASLEGSNDNSTWYSLSAPQSLAANTPLMLSVPITTRYHRTKLVNGATAQGSCKVNSSFTGA